MRKRQAKKNRKKRQAAFRARVNNMMISIRAINRIGPTVQRAIKALDKFSVAVGEIRFDGGRWTG